MTVDVKPYHGNPTHDISLSDGRETWGMNLVGGVNGIREAGSSPSTLRFGSGGTKFGDFEPGFSHIEQRTWVGGRGQDDFSEDPSRFYDSMNAWTVTDGILVPAPRWQFGTGVRTQHVTAFGDVVWDEYKISEAGQQSIWIPFTAQETITATAIEILLKRKSGATSIGSTIYIGIDTDTAGEPTEGGFPLETSGKDGQFLKSALSTTGEWFTVTLDASMSLTASTSYWLGLYIQDAKDVYFGTNGTEVAGGGYDSGFQIWSTFNIGGTPYFRVIGAEAPVKYHFIKYRGALLAGTEPDAGGAGNLYINGDWGACDDNSGDKTNLEDATKSWTADEWIGSYAYITEGPGRGECRLITDNDTNTLMVSPDWDVTHTTSSSYVILGSKKWTSIKPGSGDTIDAPVTDMCVANEILYIAQGDSQNILRYYAYNNAGTWTTANSDDGTNKATYLHSFYDPVDDVQIWRAKNDTVAVSRADDVAWGSNLTFGTEVPVGNEEYEITGLHDHDGVLFVGKTNSLWHFPDGAHAYRLNVGLDAMVYPTNCSAMATQDLFLYFNWAHSIEQYFQDNSLIDMGPWRGTGMPDTRRGPVSALLPSIGWLIGAIDGGTSNYSSVFILQNHPHEIFRAWTTNRRIRSLSWQAIPFGPPRLWIGCGTDLIYMDFPQDTINPIQDTSHNYVNEAHLITSFIDMESSGIPKLFKDLELITEDMDSDAYIAVDYQYDKDIGSSTWISADAVYNSPHDYVAINESQRRRIRLRLRLICNDMDSPPILRATVLKAFARTPIKRIFAMRVKAESLELDGRGNVSKDLKDFYNWLWSSSETTRLIRMRTSIPEIDDMWVVVEPPGVVRRSLNKLLGNWTGSFELTLREA